jgi:calcium/calmodulin-dependent protein kinase I
MMRDASDIFRSGNIKEVYSLGKDLGAGSFGVVKHAKKIDSSEQFAVKIINKKRLESEDLEALQTEIDLLSQIDHPNIVKLHEIYEDKEFFYMIFELMQGGELFERIVDKDHYSEKEASEALNPIVDAIRYCHSMGIAHRDLKPENLLYATKESNSLIKITDFGLAKVISEEDMMQTQCGTPSYVAPEVLQNDGRGYDLSVDCWSIGVILYVMLCGFPPFYHEDETVLFELIKQGEYSFPTPHCDNISEAGKDLIKKLLVVEPSKRLKADEILDHPWMKGKTGTVPLTVVSARMKEYNSKRNATPRAG